MEPVIQKVVETVHVVQNVQTTVQNNKNYNINTTVVSEKADRDTPSKEELLVANKLSEELQEKFNKMGEEVNTLARQVEDLKRMSVDEVMKDIETSENPKKELVDRAIGRILKGRVERSVSAPSRMIVKATDKL